MVSLHKTDETTPCIARHRFPFAVTLGILGCLFAFTSVAAADDGEFWDAAVSSLIYTKRVDKSYVQLKVGAEVLDGVDSMKVPPAKWRQRTELTFYGIKSGRYARVLALYATGGFGAHDTGQQWRLDAYRARLSIYRYLNGGSFSLGVFSSTREKALNEQYAAAVQPFEYAVGGAMKMVTFSLNTSALGYEFRRYFSKPDFHGFLLFNLALKIGVVFGKDSRFSFEPAWTGDVQFSWPRQKDVSTSLELVWHLNNRVLPLDLSFKNGYRYSSDAMEGDYREEYRDRVPAVKKSWEVHDSYFYSSLMLGIRY